MAKTPEGKVKDKIKKLLDEYNVYYFMPVQNGYGAPALDYHCCHNGYAVFIEAKAPGKHMTPRQEVTTVKIRKAHGVVFEVSDDTSLDILRRWLETFQYR